MRCTGPRAKDTDLWILNREELRKSNTSKHIAPKRKCRTCRFFPKFTTAGNENADEQAKEGSEAGRRRYRAGESNHDSAGTGGGFCSVAVCS